ncbi:LL-diaminopimelate aminotransferase apoenzyme [Paucidesulfovibrio gracilis DSM 16080]|uniref:Aminotransferase n=1 Tax=Paucidesulfovibrio gracilis DSM 16080 TaxID=1121449 RepID=A0A1T4WNI7_9BACT|nr:LL-diaminopimelate aminotransferase [Paucidesulfovibrio gracilis]SKA78779.1 LL-diaminopimelate aminotransferase apoenzyme [Paucidesulfovibrio gracilis DSM 16080]
MPNFALAERVASLPPYLFAAIDKAKAEVAAQGVDIISLGIGDPDLPTPEFIIDALYEAAKNPANHQYPSYTGMMRFREAVARWYAQRFDVEGLDPATEVITLIGSKEGIGHLPWAFINPGDLALICPPCYPVYATGVKFAGGEVQELPLLEENDYLPDLDGLDEETWNRAKMIFVNYPGNPTAATATTEFYARLVEKAKATNTIVVSDLAYSEIYYDAAQKPPSILAVPGAKDVAIEFHSLSKTYNMTGWRIAMAVGNEQLINGLGKIKENVDSGAFNAVQEAGIAALEQGEPHVEKARAIYKERRDATCAALSAAGIEHRVPEASVFVWARVPGNKTSAEFVTHLLKKTGVVVTPGSGFGECGEGYFRISLTVDTDRLKEAVSRISQL